MNPNDNSVPYIVYEGEMARGERTIKRLWVLCIVIFLAFVISNCAWIVYESSYEDVTQEVEQEVDTGEGDATIIGIGDYNGEGTTDGKN